MTFERFGWAILAWLGYLVSLLVVGGVVGAAEFAPWTLVVAALPDVAFALWYLRVLPRVIEVRERADTRRRVFEVVVMVRDRWWKRPRKRTLSVTRHCTSMESWWESWWADNAANVAWPQAKSAEHAARLIIARDMAERVRRERLGLPEDGPA